MALSMYDAAVNDILQAAPAKTITASGAEIPYPFPSPADWRDQWIYFLLVDRFNNPVKPPTPDEFPSNVYQGGTFAGIKEQLPYLKNLGVGAIWVSPVQMNPQWFNDYWGGYGTLDFLRIEPRFCADIERAKTDPAYADEEFRQLVDEAHALGIYIILDIVLNHVGDVFNYEGMKDSRDWKPDGEYDIYWRDSLGTPHGDWNDIGSIPNLPYPAGIWPSEFHRNDYFRRRGSYENSPTPEMGDFGQLKELVTEYLDTTNNIYPVRNFLIRAYQYLIAKFDIDGFRIDTLKYVESAFARVFGNAMREYGLSIGKKNFFTFGEVWEDNDEIKIAEFIGRNSEKDDEFIGVDAALDFPIRERLFRFAKSFAPAAEIASHYDVRREILKTIVSSHGEAGSHYVTFLENHDLNDRFHNAAFPDQTKLAVTCLMALQGIPCIYYGMEQGLTGNGDKREYSRGTLWGKPDAFSADHDLYKLISELSIVRNQFPALRYGRQYFRPCSGNGIDFGYSPYNGGVLAFSRVLNDREILIVANSSTNASAQVHVVIDANLNQNGKSWQVAFDTNTEYALPGQTDTHGIYRTVEVRLAPLEVQILY
ncbi:MAG: alpha-amylase [Anaerolineaceae bacterium]|nr:alpha-amylase [Anaerolineaceae bacterium]